MALTIVGNVWWSIILALMMVDELKYLGVTLNQTLSFKNHAKKLSNTLKFNLRNHRHIRNSYCSNITYIFKCNNSPTSSLLQDKLVSGM